MHYFTFKCSIIRLLTGNCRDEFVRSSVYCFEMLQTLTDHELLMCKSANIYLIKLQPSQFYNCTKPYQDFSLISMNLTGTDANLFAEKSLCIYTINTLHLIKSSIYQQDFIQGDFPIYLNSSYISHQNSEMLKIIMKSITL